MNVGEEVKPSMSNSPDLDWSQIRETVFMLNLAVAQIISSMSDGDESIDCLSNNFIKMAGEVKEIQLHAERIVDDDAGSVNQDSKNQILDRCLDVASAVESSIITYQFYDRLRQRLDRVSESLSSLANLIGDKEKIYNPGEWSKLHEEVRSGYTTDQERKMLDLLVGGTPIKDAIESVTKEKILPTEDDEVELF